MSPQTFFADAVLFDMDGTLTDSIAAFEAAWGKVAKDIGQDPDFVIAATHGKRGVDNFSQFKPHLGDREIEHEVERFEESIFYFADAHGLHGHLVSPRYDSDTPLSTPGTLFDVSSSVVSSTAETPELTPGHSAPISRVSSFMAADVRRPSFSTRLLNMLSIAARLRVHAPETIEDDERVQSVLNATETKKVANEHTLEARQHEAASVDRSVRILPGARKMIDSIRELSSSSDLSDVNEDLKM